MFPEDLLTSEDPILKYAGLALMVGFFIYKLIKEIVEFRHKHKERQNSLADFQAKNEFRELDLLVRDRWHEYRRKEWELEAFINNTLINFVHGDLRANIANFCSVKNGGDHITSRKQYTVTVLYESISSASGVKSLKDNWQNVTVSSQLSSCYEKAFNNRYLYYENYIETMPDGELKTQLDPIMGEHIGFFYVGRVDIEHYFITFQFKTKCPPEKRHLMDAANICENINSKYQVNDEYKKKTEVLENKLEEDRAILVRKGLI